MTVRASGDSRHTEATCLAMVRRLVLTSAVRVTLGAYRGALEDEGPVWLERTMRSMAIGAGRRPGVAALECLAVGARSKFSQNAGVASTAGLGHELPAGRSGALGHLCELVAWSMAVVTSRSSHQPVHQERVPVSVAEVF